MPGLHLPNISLAVTSGVSPAWIGMCTDSNQLCFLVFLCCPPEASTLEWHWTVFAILAMFVGKKYRFGDFFRQHLFRIEQVLIIQLFWHENLLKFIHFGCWGLALASRWYLPSPLLFKDESSCGETRRGQNRVEMSGCYQLFCFFVVWYQNSELKYWL